MTPHEVTPTIDTASIALIEQIAKRVIAESGREVAILVEQMKGLKETIAELNESIKTNFVRKEEFHGWAQRIEHMESVKASSDRMDGMEKELADVKGDIRFAWRTSIGAIITGGIAVLFSYFKT